MFDFVMSLLFLFILGMGLCIWVVRRTERDFGEKTIPFWETPRGETVKIILDMKGAFIDEFNLAFAEILRIKRPHGGSKFLQDYDPDYFKLLKAVKTLSQMPYVLSAEQAVLVERCLQMNEIDAMSRVDEKWVLKPKEIEFYTRAQKDVHNAHVDYIEALRHADYYQGLIEGWKAKLTPSNNHDQEEGLKTRLAKYQQKFERYSEQVTGAFLREYDAKMVLRDSRLKLLKMYIDPSDIDETTLKSQWGDFDRYSELFYNT